jgi:hypothetical protein
MLWTKGWLETRVLLWLVLAIFAVNIGLELILGARVPVTGDHIATNFLLIWVFFPGLLAGNGIRTPARFRAARGAHLSMYFTLSLPVTRFRLLAARAALGLVETIVVDAAVVIAMWTAFPTLRTDTALYFLTVAVYTVALYSLSVLVAALREGPWRVWGVFLSIIGIRWLMIYPLHSIDILYGIAGGAPLLTHKLPWISITVSLALAVLFLGSAFKAIESREY